MNPIHAATCFIVVALLAATSLAQKPPKAPKSTPVNRKVLSQLRGNISKSTKDLTKESVEDCQTRLDAAANEYRAWLADNRISAYDKQVVSVTRLIDKQQEEIDKKRGSPPKRPEFQPFIGVWRARDGSCKITIDEFGRGHVFVDLFKEEGMKGGVPLTRPIVVESEKKSFTLADGAPFLDDSRFTLGDDGKTMMFDVTIQTTPPGATKQETVRKSFTLIRDSKSAPERR